MKRTNKFTTNLQGNFNSIFNFTKLKTFSILTRKLEVEICRDIIKKLDMGWELVSGKIIFEYMSIFVD